MFRQYLKIALRNFRKNLLYSLLNLVGLAIGLGACILIVLYVLNEYKYDKYHSNSERIYRVVGHLEMDGADENASSCPFPVSKAIKEAYPELIESSTRFFNGQVDEHTLRIEDQVFTESKYFMVDSTVFDIFDIPIIQGDSNALDKPMSMALSSSAAKKYFGDANPIGQIIQVDDQVKFEVRAIFEDIPAQSHFRFDVLTSISTIRKLRGSEINSWVWNPCWTYILLKENAKAWQLEEKLPAFVSSHFFDAEKDNISLGLQNLESIHLYSDLDFEIAPNSKATYVYILLVIATFILLIALINYINLTTATAAGRGREIAMRKVLGSSRTQLIVQFLVESTFWTFLALLFSFCLVENALPFFNNLVDRSLSLSQLLSDGGWLIWVLFGLVLGVIAGIYPALLLTAIRPIKILKENFSDFGKNSKARKLLVGIQFTVSSILLIGTAVVYFQWQHMQQSDLGFNKESVMVVKISQSPVVRKYKAFTAELKNIKDVESVTGMEYILGTDHNNHEFHPEGRDPEKWHFFPTMIVRHHFLTTFNVPIVTGRDYSPEHTSDEMEAILINEAMVRQMGWTNEEALGKRFSSLQGQEKIVGVFKDFNFTSLHNEIKPLVLNMKETEGGRAFFTRYIAIRFNTSDLPRLIEEVEGLWKAHTNNRPLSYSFMDEDIESLYEGEKKLGVLAALFSLLSILIALLGLVGLISFLSEQKKKEMGIRKVFGAEWIDIFKLMSKEFIGLVFISAVLSAAISIPLINDWLSQFAESITLDYLPFVLSLLLNILVVMIVVLIHSYQLFRSDPIKVIKYE